jgi:hypothetical protein
MKTILRVCVILVACLHGANASAQFLRLLRPYDGTSANIVRTESASFDYRSRVVRFTRSGSELTFEIQRPQRSSFLFVSGNFHIALEQFVPADEPIGPELRLRLTNLSPSGRPMGTVNATFTIESGTEVPIHLESGWWSDFAENQANLARGMDLERVAGRIHLRYLTFPGLGSIDDQINPRLPGTWISGSAGERTPYVSIPVYSYEGGVCLACTGGPLEQPVPAGRVILYALTPTTAIMAPPNEEARLIELGGVSAELERYRRRTPLSGRWTLLNPEDAAFGGLQIDIGPETIDAAAFTYRYEIQHAFGGGRAEFDSSGVRIFLRFAGFNAEFPFLNVPFDGVGNQRLYRMLGDGRWRPAMVRVD